MIDGDLAPDADLGEVARGIGDTAGGAPTLDTISGKPVAIVNTSTQTLVSWIESPFEITVLGAHEATARTVARAVLGGPTN